VIRRLLLALIGVDPCRLCTCKPLRCEGWPRCLPWEVDAALAACPAVPFEEPTFPPLAVPVSPPIPDAAAGGGDSLGPPGSVRSAGPGGSEDGGGA
jgi:hypothetical protein